MELSNSYYCNNIFKQVMANGQVVIVIGIFYRAIISKVIVTYRAIYLIPTNYILMEVANLATKWGSTL